MSRIAICTYIPLCALAKRKGPAVQAVILAGGLGTRLRAMLGNGNKPMAAVAGKPFLEYLVLQLKRHGINQATLCVGYRGEIVQRYFGSGAHCCVDISYSFEEDLRGTAGALKVAQPAVQSDTFIILNGDSFFDIDLNALIAYHHQKKALATIALAKVLDTRPFGAVETASDGAIVGFLEKGQQRGIGLVNAGIYVFQHDILDRIPDGCPVSLETDVFPQLIGQRFYGMHCTGYFVDIGVPEAYLDLQADPSRLQAATPEGEGVPC